MALINKKHALQLVCAVVLITVGSALLIAGFLVPPLGIIDSSVLVAFGEILTFAGALFGIDYHYKITHLSLYHNQKRNLMPQTTYNLHLKGFVGGADFDRNYVDYILGKHMGKPVNVLIDSLGCSVATALSIASAFRNHADVSVHFVGMNASAATRTSVKYDRSKGEIVGVSFTKDGISFRGSRIDRSMGFYKLDKQLGSRIAEGMKWQLRLPDNDVGERLQPILQNVAHTGQRLWMDVGISRHNHVGAAACRRTHAGKPRQGEP